MAFPTSTVKSNGNEVTTRNLACGTFTGKIIEVQEDNLDRMQNAKRTLCAVLHIKVDGQAGEFNHFIHFNPDKAQASIGKMVADCKAAILSAGQPVDETEHDAAWVKEKYCKLRDSNLPVTFTQSTDSQGRVNLNFTGAVQQPTTF